MRSLVKQCIVQYAYAPIRPTQSMSRPARIHHYSRAEERTDGGIQGNTDGRTDKRMGGRTNESFPQRQNLSQILRLMRASVVKSPQWRLFVFTFTLLQFVHVWMSDSTVKGPRKFVRLQRSSTSRVEAVADDPLFAAVTGRGIKRKLSREPCAHLRSVGSRDDVSSTEDVGGAARAKSCKKSRRSFLLNDSKDLKEEAEAFKSSWQAPCGKRPKLKYKGWLEAFIKMKWPSLTESETKKEKERIKKLMRRDNFGTTAVRPGRPLRGSPKCGKKQSKRKRAAGGGRVSTAVSIDFELWQWFVDTILNVKGRLPAFLLLAEAARLADDLRRWVQRQIDNGSLPPDYDLNLPHLDYAWLRGWRERHRVTWRTVNLTLKCSLVVLKRRLLALWCNVLRLRWLAYYVLGPDAIIVWINCDQKPLWFTSAHDMKTLYHEGVQGVYVNESVPMTRERFTGMTRTMWPCLIDDGKDLAVMFRAEGEEHSVLRSRLVVPERTLLQFAPKGSFRLEHTLEYYEWVLPANADELSLYPKGPNQDKAVFCNLVDWYGPNLRPELDELVEDRGGMTLRLPGCVTGHVQVNDVGAHAPYSGYYKQDEVLDNTAQLRAGAKMPSVSKQTVLNRAAKAWQKVDHERVSKHFVGVGFANNLDGSEDKVLNSNVRQIWYDLEMPVWREQIRGQIHGEVQAKRLTSMLQYRDVLVPYEEHPPDEEGAEACEWTTGAEATNAAVDTDEECDAIDETDVATAAGAGAEAVEGLTQAAVVAKSEEAEYQAAIESLEQLSGKKEASAVREALKTLRASGGDAVTESSLERRLMQLAQIGKASDAPAALYLRHAALQRQRVEVERRQQAREADAELKRLAVQERIEKAKLETAKEEGKVAAAEARARVEQAKNARAEAEAAKRKTEKERKDLAMNFASVLCGRCAEYLVENGKALKKELDLVGSSSKMKHSANKTVAAPRFLERSDLTAYKDVTRPPKVGEKHTPARFRMYASLEFSWRLFGKKGELGTVDSIPFLMERLIERTLPGYGLLLGKRYAVKDLIQSCSMYLDWAYLEANWRYSRLVGAELFPPGLHEWPPPVGWMDTITRRAAKGPHVSVSTIATSSSSSGSKALASHGAHAAVPTMAASSASSGSKALTSHGAHVPASTMTSGSSSSGSSMLTLHSKWQADDLP